MSGVGFPDKVEDAANCVHRLVEELGAGGQGTVYLTSDPSVAVKLLHNATDEERTALSRRLETVRILPIDGIDIARPGAILVGEHVGYVMPLLTDMQPLKALLTPADKLSSWYLGTGGLRQRLQLLGRLAETLGRLHALSLVYADISPHNVFVSKSAEASEVWLIDADNLHFQSSSDVRIFTHGYGAPEVITGRMGNTTLSDIHSFAVIAYELLTTVHPFIGDYVSDGEPELEEAAFMGEVPWVEDTDDPRNRTTRGIPRDMVVSEGLMALFQQCFRNSKGTPLGRPSITHWAEALYRAADLTVCCPNCRASFFVNRRLCPWCESPRPEFIMVSSYCWDPESSDDDEFGVATGVKPVWQSVLPSDREMTLPQRWIAPFLVETARGPAVKITKVRDGLAVEALDGRPYRVGIPGTAQSDLVGQRKILPLPHGKNHWVLHCGPQDAPHRLVRFAAISAVKA